VANAYAGRLFDHVHLRVRDLAASRRFYEAVLPVFDIPIRGGEEWFSADELFVSADGAPTSAMHFAFQASDEETVRRFHEAGLAAGGRDNGRPGERSYHPGYYSAYVLDPDGTNVEAVYHGPVRRSATAVEFFWDE
jgi:catechol 2,3-dioxygenase-like lactoylglutathione lyase family enzyme